MRLSKSEQAWINGETGPPYLLGGQVGRKATVIRLYRTGRGLGSIANEYAMNTSQVRKILIDAGVYKSDGHEKPD